MKKQSLRFAMVVLLDLALAASMLCTGTTARCNLPPSSPATSGGQPNLSAVERPSVLPVPCAGHLVPLAPSDIAQVWANDGGDKVTRDELRATGDSDAMCNSVWDGTGVSLFGGRNEVVAFNLVLEAPALAAANVDVSLTSLVGPAGASITTRTTNGDGVFGYTGRNIELFYVRYLEIKGLSTDLFYTGYTTTSGTSPSAAVAPTTATATPTPARAGRIGRVTTSCIPRSPCRSNSIRPSPFRPAPTSRSGATSTSRKRRPRGMLVPLQAKDIDTNSKPALVAMDEALRERVEHLRLS